MSVAIPIPLLQNLPDVNVTPGVGVDEYALTWDNDTARFVLRSSPVGALTHTYTATGVSEARPVAFAATLTIAPATPVGMGIDYHFLDVRCSSSTANVDGTTRLYPLESTAESYQASPGVIGQLVGVYGQALQGGTGTVTEMVAIRALTQAIAAGPVGTMIGVNISAPTIAGGALTTAYGLKVENIAVGTTKYAIHTGTGLVRFGDHVSTVGNLGVGIATATTALHVVGAATITAGIRPAANSATGLQLQNATGTSILNVDTTNDRVGIGSISPGYQLFVSGGGQATAALTDAGYKAGAIYIHDTYGNAGNGGTLFFSAAVTTAGVPQAAIKLLLTNGGGNGLGDLAFSTRNATADVALTERVRILANGRVGIGTSAPGALLHVAGGDIKIDNNRVIYGSLSTDGSNKEMLKYDSGNILNVGAGISNAVYIGGVSNAPPIDFLMTNVHVFRVTPLGGLTLGDMGTDPGVGNMILTGRLGVGISVPAAKLHVDQSSTTAAVPVLIVDQADVSEEFIRFVGTSTTDASQSLVDAANMTTPGALVGWLKIYVQDDAASGAITDQAYFVPFYAAPTA